MRTLANEATKKSAKTKVKGARRPLLVIDGDSFAHRSYHALPKTIRRSDGNGRQPVSNHPTKTKSKALRRGLAMGSSLSPAFGQPRPPLYGAPSQFWT